MLTKQDIRQRMIQRRHQLSDTDQAIAAKKLVQQMTSQDYWLNSTRIALYFSVNGEINPKYLMENTTKQFFFPKIHKSLPRTLQFIAYLSNQKLSMNQFGIPEPIITDDSLITSVQSIDIICLPLVAYDNQKNRLGMGGGFYDHTLSNLKNKKGQRPYLVGLAYDFQAMDTLPVDPWDISLDDVISVSVR